jgi:hypothetical protein
MLHGFRIDSRTRTGVLGDWLRASSGALVLALLSYGLGACTPDTDDDDGGVGGTSVTGGSGNGGTSAGAGGKATGGLSSGGSSTGGQATGGAGVGGAGGQGGAAEACQRAGGTVVTRLCCQNIADFPNLCATGACGCAPANSRDTLVCQCPSGTCFDGQACPVDPHIVYATTDVVDSCPAAHDVTLTLHNNSNAILYLPGCGDYWVTDGVTYTPNVVCAWEGIARPVPAGTVYVAAAKYTCPDASGSRTLCFQVGLQCTVANVPLSQAGCNSLQWVCAPRFPLIPTPLAAR